MDRRWIARTGERMTRKASVAVLALAALALGACGDQNGAAKQTADDALIAAQVRAKAIGVDAATVSLMHVAVAHGTVTLTGKIANADERQRIEDGAHGVGGVTTVVDRLVVDPSAPTGAQLEADLTLAGEIHAALVAQTGENAARVHVDVHRGVVTLTGTLPSNAHRDVVDETVRSLKGVRKLNDDIAVTPGA